LGPDEGVYDEEEVVEAQAEEAEPAPEQEARPGSPVGAEEEIGDDGAGEEAEDVDRLRDVAAPF
jgi:hypothetical protein